MATKNAVVVAVFEGNEIRAEVRVHALGFGVSVVDPDAGEVVASIPIFPAVETAIAYAKRCAGVSP